MFCAIFKRFCGLAVQGFEFTLNNLGNESVALTKGQQIGSVETVVVVPENDPVWAESSMAVLLCQTKSEIERNKQIKRAIANWSAVDISRKRPNGTNVIDPIQCICSFR